MSKPDLSSLYKLEFYRKQDNWRLASKPRRRGKAKCATSSSGDFNKTYVLNKSTANITTKLNDAFLETDPDSGAGEDNGHGDMSQNETQIMNSFNELWSNPEEPEKEAATTTPKPQTIESPTVQNVGDSLSPNLDLPKVFLPDLPSDADLWSEKVDFELNDCNDFIDPKHQNVDNTPKATENPNILVNLLRKHKFFINELDRNAAADGITKENDAAKENNDLAQTYEQKNSLQNEQVEFNRVDMLTRLKRKIFRTNLLNNNILIPNANQQPVLENNNFESYFNNVEKTNEDAKKSLSLHERNFEITNQEQRNFERNFIETTLPTMFQKDLEFNENTAQMIGNATPNFKNNVKPFKNINNDFQYVPTDLTENAQNCYLNQKLPVSQNQYIINNYKPIFFNQNFKPFLGDYKPVKKNYKAYLKNCQILTKNYHPEGVAKNFQSDPKSFQIDPKNFQINPNNFQNNENNFQINESNFLNNVNNFENNTNNFQNNDNNLQNNENTFQNNTNNFQNNGYFRSDANNFHNNENNFENDENFRIDGNNLPNNANNFQNNANNFHFDPHSSTILDHNFNTLPCNYMLHQNLMHHQNSAHQNPAQLQNPTQHQNTLLHHMQIPENHQIFVRNPQVYSQIAYDPGLETSGVLDDPCFEWTENFQEQVMDDIDGIWSEGQGALDGAAKWLNLVVDEENLDPNMKQICTEIEDLNMNATSSTDSATFMRGAALAPHSSEISLSTAAGVNEKYDLASLVHKHARVLKCLLSRANSEHSLCVQTPSSITQHKRHSATNTTPDQSCDFYPTRDVGSNTPLINPINPTDPNVCGDFDSKLDQLREKLAQDQIKFENYAADQKLYTVFTKFQQYNQNCIETIQLHKMAQDNVQAIEHKFEPSEQNLQQVEQIFQSTERKIEHVEHNFLTTEQRFQLNEHRFESPDRQIQLVEHNGQLADYNIQPTEHNLQSTEHNVQQIEHKSGHYNMRTVNTINMGPYKKSSNNFGPYNRQRRSHNKNYFHYLGNKNINQINICGLD